MSKASGQMDSEAKVYLDQIIKEPYKIGHWLGFDDLTELHNEWLKLMMFSEEDETLLAHRGSYKTTCLSIAIALLMLIFPNLIIIFLRKTDDDVKEVIQQVAKILKSDIIQLFALKIYGIQLVLVEESAFKISTNLMNSTKGASQLLGLGIKTSLTGKHADLVITDDIVNLKDRISKPERDLIKTAYMELQNIKNRGGRILNTGTPWHKEDAITGMPHKHIYDCYSTGLISRDKLEQLRQSMTSSLFAANYELKHIADADALFGNPAFTSEVSRIYDGIAHIDAAYGGADSTAFTIMKERDGKLVTFGKKWDKHVDECMDEIMLLCDYYKAGTIHCEDNADKGYLKKEIRNRGRFAKGYHENMNKYIKISTYLKRHWTDMEFLEDTDPEYINQILDYTENAEHDDSPDSCASLVRQIRGNRKWLV